MLELVWRRVSSVIPDTVIATDSTVILDAAAAFGARAVLTPPDLPSGTLRCIEAFRLIEASSDVLLNVQGDEPFISPHTIRAVISRLSSPDLPHIATAATRFPADGSFAELSDPNSVKLVTDARSRAMYFSRSVIPSLRGVDCALWPESYPFLIHQGIYAFRSTVIQQVCGLRSYGLSDAEKLEQLAWLQAGMAIGVALVDDVPLSVDTPHDLIRANKIYDAIYRS